MPDGPFADTIDWDAYWAGWEPDAEEEYAASVSGHHHDRLERFFDEVGVPETAAFVGCEPARLAAAIARAHPDTRAVGVDASSAVLDRNRATYGDLPNLSFERAALPEFPLDERFDLVFCYATLHYVGDVERALETLFAAVSAGGHLVCNYPNPAYREAHQDAQGELRERLHLPLSGANLLTRRAIEDCLDREVRDFWATVDAEGPVVRPENPCVVAEK